MGEIQINGNLYSRVIGAPALERGETLVDESHAFGKDEVKCVKMDKLREKQEPSEDRVWTNEQTAEYNN